MHGKPALFREAYLANRAREVDTVRSNAVGKVRRGEIVRRNALLDPAYDGVEHVVLRIVRERRLGITCGAE